MSQPDYFRVEQHDDTLVFAALDNVGALAEYEATEEWATLLEMMDSRGAKNAIVDFSELDYFGSIVLYLLVRLWKRVSGNQGRLVICCVSQVGREILETAKFDSLWPIVGSREEALELVRE